jgi:hypothetical protein
MPIITAVMMKAATPGIRVVEQATRVRYPSISVNISQLVQWFSDDHIAIKKYEKARSRDTRARRRYVDKKFDVVRTMVRIHDYS